mgnify:CR=1 FL=1
MLVLGAAGGVGITAAELEVENALATLEAARRQREQTDRLAERFGRQCVVIGIDSREEDGEYRVASHTGDPDRTRYGRRSTLEWVREVQERGAGEDQRERILREAADEASAAARFFRGHEASLPVLALGLPV